MALPYKYWSPLYINRKNMSDIPNLFDRANFARESAIAFFGGVHQIAHRLDMNHRTLWNMRYEQTPFSERLAWTIDGWNEGISFAYLRPDLVESEDDPILGNDIPPRCMNCAYRFGTGLVPDI